MIHIALVHPDIAENTGNIGRLCVALGATLHLVRPLGFILDDKKIRRTGLDYWQHLELVVHNSLGDFLENTKTARRFFLTTKTTTVYTEMSYQKGDFLVFGAESRGLPETVLQEYQKSLLTIPMPGKVRSLNVANAAAIVAYEAYRQITH